jgi:uncharacterized iron-regulated membrane protein
MTVRKIIFWTHLITAVLMAMIILLLSVTGVLLTYSRQIKQWADFKEYSIASEPAAQRKSIDELLESGKSQLPELNPNIVGIISDPDAPATVGSGRRDRIYIDPYSGVVLGKGNDKVRGFFDLMTSWHRRLNLSGESSDLGRAITNTANLVLMFLMLSGLYLWLPKIWKWPMFRSHLFFSQQGLSGKARDFNWHHVFGFWTSIPLIVIVFGAMSLYYPWTKDMIYFVAGEKRVSSSPESPVPTASTQAVAQAQQDQIVSTAELGRPAVPTYNKTSGQQRGSVTSEPMSLEALFTIAADQYDHWNKIEVTVPKGAATNARFSIDQGTGGQPHKKYTLTLSRINGDITKIESFADKTPASKVTSYLRWLHTGEAFGMVSQTIAGLVTLALLLMVWTGVALAYRRLVQPLLK